MKTRFAIAAASLALVSATQAFAFDVNEGKLDWPALSAPISQAPRGVVGNSTIAIDGQDTWPALNAPISTAPRGTVGNAVLKEAIDGQLAWPQLERGLVRG